MSVSRLLFLGIMSCLFVSPPGFSAEVSVSKIGEYKIGSNAYGPLNLRGHQHNAILSSRGYQYAVYYSTKGQDRTRRYVTVGRRKLPDGPWQRIVFDDYVQTVNDSHNVISFGICEGDGTLHMAFDHHNVTLNYRVSVIGLTRYPEKHKWSAEKFKPICHALAGTGTDLEKTVTYPRFFSMPDGRLQFIRRLGISRISKSLLYTYSPETHLWACHGEYIDGTVKRFSDKKGREGLGVYLMGVNYHKNRLHIAWNWRAGNRRYGRSSSGANNFDIMYAYSDDYGRTWKNQQGQLAGRTGVEPITYEN